MYCKNCGAKLDNDALFCMNCGVKITDNYSIKFCSTCGNKLEDDAIFCSKCGNKIYEEQIQSEIKVEAKIEPSANNEKEVELVQENLNTEEKHEINSSVSETKFNSDDRISKKQKRIGYLFILLLVCIGIGIITGKVLSERKSAIPSECFVADDIFDFDFITPYTFNSSDGSYEYDCYYLNKKAISKLWNNPPRYFMYNNKTYEVDNEKIEYDYDEEDDEYSVTIIWGDYDGTYYHFLGVVMINKHDSMWLWKPYSF